METNFTYQNGHVGKVAHFEPSTRHTLATQYTKFDNGEVWQMCRVHNACVHYDETPKHIKVLFLRGEMYYGNMNNGIAYKAY